MGESGVGGGGGKNIDGDEVSKVKGGGGGKGGPLLSERDKTFLDFLSTTKRS